MLAARPSTLTVAACALTVATLAGCGGSSSGGGGSSALSKADLDTQASAICEAEETAGQAVPEPDDITDATQAAAYFDKIDPIIQGTTSKLAALKPDSDAAADWSTFMKARTQWSTEMHGIRAKADAKDPSGLSDLQQLSTADLEAAADAVGATGCDESDDSGS